MELVNIFENVMYPVQRQTPSMPEPVIITIPYSHEMIVTVYDFLDAQRFLAPYNGLDNVPDDKDTEDGWEYDYYAQWKIKADHPLFDYVFEDHDQIILSVVEERFGDPIVVRFYGKGRAMNLAMFFKLTFA